MPLFWLPAVHSWNTHQLMISSLNSLNGEFPFGCLHKFFFGQTRFSQSMTQPLELQMNIKRLVIDWNMTSEIDSERTDTDK